MQDSLPSFDIYSQEIDYRFLTDNEELDRMIEEAFQDYCGLKPFDTIEGYELKEKIMGY